jgi:uncharacterized protein
LTARFAFAGHDFHIVDKTGLYWPKRRALLFADLHLEKASWFGERGQMLPPYDSQATLERIVALISETGAREIWCLGDNFHDDAGPSRLSASSTNLLGRMTKETDWHWITGNHDEHLPDGVGGSIHVEREVDDLILRHEAEPSEGRPELSGHFHPKIRARARGRSVSRPCFLLGTHKLIFPAFGAFAGGMDAAEAARIASTGHKTNAVLSSAGQLVMLPLDSNPEKS